MRKWLLVMTILAAGPAGAGAEEGRCISAAVQSTMILPDGSTHAPGVLKVCLAMSLSPVSALHTLYVDGMPVGVFAARVGEPEGAGRGSGCFFVFLRNARGELALQGYATDFSDRSLSYRLSPGGPQRAETVADREPVRGQRLVLVDATR